MGQAGLLSPMLFSAVGEKITRLVNTEIGDAGYNIGGRSIWNLRYADDTMLLAKSKQELKHHATCIEVHRTSYGLKNNTKNTNVMTVNGAGNVCMSGTEIKKVDKFKYLGSILSTDDPSSCEIRARVAVMKSTMSSLTAVWTSTTIRRDLKKRLVKSLIWSVALCGCESWTMRE